jgi:hypothetical protein
MTMRRNPAVPGVDTYRDRHWKHTPARLVDAKAHWTSTEVRAAKSAVRAVLEGRGTFLGTGNFGATYRVDLPTGPVAVKFGSRRTVHTQSPMDLYAHEKRKWSQEGRSLEQMRLALLHEAGVANVLWDHGHRVIPQTVYVEEAGRPALVREYGEIGSMTSAEYDALGEALVAVIEDGFKVSDDLLIARRVRANGHNAPAGSLFIADVGIWSPMSKKADTRERRDARSNVYGLLRLALAGGDVRKARSVPPARVELEEAEGDLRRDIEKGVAAVFREMTEQHVATLRKERESAGMER